MVDLRIGVYPGTFDPITNGHLDIISRAVKVVDRLVIGVAVNAGKGPLFEVDQRVIHVKAEVDSLGPETARKIEVRPFDNLLTQLAEDAGATLIIRGLRAISDFDYEFQMASMNAKLSPDIDTVCLMASDKFQFIASRLVKEIAIMGGNVAPFVSAAVAEHLKERLARGDTSSIDC